MGQFCSTANKCFWSFQIYQPEGKHQIQDTDHNYHPVTCDWMFPKLSAHVILFMRYMFIIQDTVEILFFRQFCVIELIKTAHIIIRMDSLLFHEIEFLLFLELICDDYLKASFGGLLTSLSKLLDINWSCPYCLDEHWISSIFHL